MKSFVKAIFFACCGLFLLSLFNIHKLPPKNEILEELYKDPLQQKTDQQPFNITRKDITYFLTPVYSYEMYGLVVTYHNSNSWLDISHKNWKDYLNTKDISTIWGYNLEAGDYKKLKYYHADWTGYYSYRRPVNFKGSYFANNHFLTDNMGIEKEIMKTTTGDQIYVKGYLVNYSHSNGQFSRHTSTTREDTGNGACEIVFVTDYKILKEANHSWRVINNITKIVGIICLLYLIVALFIETPVST